MHQSVQVWVVDDDPSIRWVLNKSLSKVGYEVRCFESAAEISSALETSKPQVLISDIRMPETDGISLLDAVKNHHPDLPVIIMTAHSDLDSTLSAFQGGAFEFVTKPFDIDEVSALVLRASQLNKKETKPKTAEKTQEIIGSSAAMNEVFRAIGRLANSPMTVLITGESGTGKELVAKALHKHSPRSASPFIGINTAAIPRELLESDLFGHERGAFTGAHQLHRGRFEQANHGTLFLDEIGDMPLDLQARLLRVLAESQFYRVGGQTPVSVDVRIIAATHQNLEQHVKDGLLRDDLYHRLNVIRIHTPPLRERREDITALANFFLKKVAKELNVSTKRLNTSVKKFLEQQPWPGNVRQLENVCRWLTVMTPGTMVQVSDLPPELFAENQNSDSPNEWELTLRAWINQRIQKGETPVFDAAIKPFERILIECALQHTGGKKAAAAQILGWGRNTLSRKISELKI